MNQRLYSFPGFLFVLHTYGQKQHGYEMLLARKTGKAVFWIIKASGSVADHIFYPTRELTPAKAGFLLLRNYYTQVHPG